jgi:putative membrane protein
LIELLAMVLLGILLGLFSGLAPGIHLNTIAAIVVLFARQGDFSAVAMVVAMSIAHSFFDFIPSILLGAPDAENFLSVLPGHRLLLKGKGLEAIGLAVNGCFFGVIISVALLPLFSLFVQRMTGFLYKFIPLILGFVLLVMVFSEKGWKKAWAALAIALCGALGVIALGGNIGVGNALFCLATGFFGASTLLVSLFKKQAFARQKAGKPAFNAKRAVKMSFFGSIAGSIVAFLPSIGPNEAAFLVSKLVGRVKTKDFLVMLGSISSANMLFSFFTLFLIGKARTGAAAAVKELFELQAQEMFQIAAIALVAAGISALLAIAIAKKAVEGMQRIDYFWLNLAVLGFLTMLAFLFSGLQGLLLFGTATAIGLLPALKGNRRTGCMAFLMVPTMLFYLGV